jgi:hypothetical protein
MFFILRLCLHVWRYNRFFQEYPFLSTQQT